MSADDKSKNEIPDQNVPTLDKSIREDCSVDSELKNMEEAGDPVKAIREELLEADKEFEEPEVVKVVSDSEVFNDEYSKEQRVSYKKVGLALLVVASLFTGGYYGVNHFWSSSTSGSIEDSIVRMSEVYRSTDDENMKVTSAALSIGNENLSLDHIKRAVAEFSERENLSDQQLKSLKSSLVEVIRMKRNGVKKEDQRTKLSLINAIANADKVGLLSVDRYTFIVTAILSTAQHMNPADLTSFIADVLAEETMKVKIEARDRAMILVSLSEKSEKILENQSVDKVAEISRLLKGQSLLIYAEGVRIRARTLGVHDEAEASMIVRSLLTFGSEIGLKRDYTTEVIGQYLISIGVSPNDANRKIRAVVLVDSLRSTGAKDEDLINQVKNQLAIEGQGLSLADNSMLIATAVQGVAVSEGYQENESIAIALAAASQVVAHSSGEEEEKIDAIHGVVDSLLKNSGLRQAKIDMVKAQFYGYSSELAKDKNNNVIPMLNAAVESKIVQLNGRITNNDWEKQSKVFLGAVETNGADKNDIAVATAQVEAITQPSSNTDDSETITLRVVEATAKAAESLNIEENQLAVDTGRIVSKIHSRTEKEQKIVEAKVAASHLAKRFGLNEVQVSMAAAMAGARENAKLAGLNKAEQQAIGERAAEKMGEASALPSSEVAKSIELILSSQESNRTPKENAGQRARIAADAEGKDTIEQEVAGQIAMLNYEGKRKSTPQTIMHIATAALAAKTRANALSLTEAEVEAIGESAAKKAAEEVGITGKNFLAMYQEIDVLLSTTDLSSNKGLAELEEFSGSKPNIEIQQQLLKLQLRTEVLENQLTKERQKTDALADIQKRLESVEGRQIVISKRVEKIVDLAQKTVDVALKDLKIEVSKLRSNFGWISNRQCESEALIGIFSHEKACGEIYKKVSSDYRAAKSSNRLIQLPSATIPNVSGDVRERDEISTFSSLPETITPTAKLNGGRSESRRQSLGVCDRANGNWHYTSIWDEGAVIRRFDGHRVEVTFGTEIGDLGQTLFFQANKRPKFVQFEKGLICGA